MEAGTTSPLFPSVIKRAFNSSRQIWCIVSNCISNVAETVNDRMILPVRIMLGNAWLQMGFCLLAFASAWHGQSMVRNSLLAATGWNWYLFAAILMGLAGLGIRDAKRSQTEESHLFQFPMVVVTIALLWIAQSLAFPDQFATDPPSDSGIGHWSWYFITLLLVGLIGSMTPSRECDSRWPGWAGIIQMASIPIRILTALLGMLFISYSTWCWLHMQYDVILVWPFSIGLLLFLVAFGHPIGFLQRSWWSLERNGHWVLLAGVLAVAAGLRFWRLEEFPMGVWYDEALLGIEAREVLQRADYTSMGVLTANPNLFDVFTAGFTLLLGDSLWTLRAFTAVIGILTCLAVYGMGTMVWGRSAGLAAAFFIAVSKWNINFSRFHMPNIAAPLFAALAFGALLWGMRNRRLLGYVLAGFFLGLGLHMYTAFRLMPPVAAMVLFGHFLVDRGHRKTAVWGGVLMVLVSCVVVSPQIAYALTHWEEWTSRMSETSVFRPNEKTNEQAWHDVWSNLHRHLKMFHVEGDFNGRHGLSGDPRLDNLTGALFILGIAECLSLSIFGRRRRNMLSTGKPVDDTQNELNRSPYNLLLLWLGIGLLGGILSLEFEAPQSARTTSIMSACALLAALPVRRYWLAAGDCVGLRLRWIALFALLPAAVWCTKDNADTYFNKQMNHPRTYQEFSPYDTGVARYIERLDREKTAVLSQSVGTMQMRYLVPEPFEHLYFLSFNHFPLATTRRDKDIVYVLENWRMPLPKEYWLHYYPSGRFQQFTSPFGQDIFFTFTIPATLLDDPCGLVAEVRRGDERGELISSEIQKEPHWPDSLEGVNPAEVVVVWKGSILLNLEHDFAFDILGALGGYVRINDRILPSIQQNRLLTDSHFLPRGVFDFMVVAKPGVDQPSQPLQWSLGGGGRWPMPFEYLFHRWSYPHGLRGYYIDDPAWGKRPVYEQTDPIPNFRWHPDPLTSNRWSAMWQGYLMADVAGMYIFEIISNDRAELHIDGKRIAFQDRGHQHYRLELTQGIHTIFLRYKQTRGFAELRLLWGPPERSTEYLASDRLYPTRFALERAGYFAPNVPFEDPQFAGPPLQLR